MTTIVYQLLWRIILKRFIIIGIILLSFQSIALDLDREKINVAYMGLPTEPIVNAADRNYSVSYGSAYKQIEFQRTIEDIFHIEGFERFQSNATVHIAFQFDEITVTGTEVLSESRKVKNSDGHNYVEFYYIPVLSYDTYAKVIISYANGESKTFNYGTRNNKFNGQEAYTTSDANISLTRDLYQIVYEMHNQFVIDTVNDVDVKLNKIHGYQPIHTTDYLLILDSRFYPEYKDYKRYYLLTNRLFKQMTPFDSIEGLKSEMQVVINFLKQIPAKYPNNKRADIKMRYASFYNLAKIYYYLDEFEKSIDYYEKVIQNDYHEGQSKRNIKAIDDLKDLLAVNQVSGRHFNIQVAQAQSPQLSPAVVNDGFIYIDAEIQTIDKQLIEGKIELNAAVTDIIYELQNLTIINFKFLNDSDEIEMKNIYTSTIETMQLSEDKLQRINYTSQANQSGEQISTGKVNSGVLITALAVQLFQSDKVSLFSYNNELIIKKANVTTAQSTSSTAFSFAFKKKLGQLFSDCTSMQADIKSGQYKNNAEGLTQAVARYANCQN